MRLRNKKTGSIWDIPKMRHPTMQEDDISFFVYGKNEGHLFSYKSLAELNADWEDYKPAEPLIKDEKIRKAVKAWADVCRLKYAIYKQSSNEFYDPDTRGKFAIKFTLKPIEVRLDDGKCYTIAELCGEEERRNRIEEEDREDNQYRKRISR